MIASSTWSGDLRSFKYILITSLISGVVLLPVATTGSGEGPLPTNDEAAAAPAEPLHVESEVVNDVVGPASRYLPCTGASEPANFTYYSLGAVFKELPLVAVLRECGKPFPDEPIRSNSVTFVYGVAPGVPCIEPPNAVEGGCAPPLQVHSEPICEIGPADYDRGQEGHGYRLRGVPAADFDNESRAELYTADTTVTISGLDPTAVTDAVEALRAEPRSRSPANPLLPAINGGGADLPQPSADALAGKLGCVSAVYASAN